MIRKGRFKATINTEKLTPETAATIRDIPTIPPSITLFGVRKTSSPRV